MKSLEEFDASVAKCKINKNVAAGIKHLVNAGYDSYESIIKVMSDCSSMYRLSNKDPLTGKLRKESLKDYYDGKIFRNYCRRINEWMKSKRIDL